jgi:hypothetical protein
MHAGFHERPVPAIAGVGYRKQRVLFLTDTRWEKYSMAKDVQVLRIVAIEMPLGLLPDLTEDD